MKCFLLALKSGFRTVSVAAMRRPYRAESRKSNSLLSVLPETHHPDRRASAPVAADGARRAHPPVVARDDHGPVPGRVAPTAAARALSAAGGRRGSRAPRRRGRTSAPKVGRVGEEVRSASCSCARAAEARTSRRDRRSGRRPALRAHLVDRVHHPVAAFDSCGATPSSARRSPQARKATQATAEVGGVSRRLPSFPQNGRFPSPARLPLSRSARANLAARSAQMRQYTLDVRSMAALRQAPASLAAC